MNYTYPSHLRNITHHFKVLEYRFYPKNGTLRPFLSLEQAYFSYSELKYPVKKKLRVCDLPAGCVA